MGGRRQREVPARLARLQERFGEWRRTRTFGTRIPEQLWASAAKVAVSCGVSQTAIALGLSYCALKKRVDRASSKSAPARKPASTPAFIELADSLPLACTGECIADFENPDGAKMRVHLKGGDDPDIIALARSFWGMD